MPQYIVIYTFVIELMVSDINIYTLFASNDNAILQNNNIILENDNAIMENDNAIYHFENFT